MPPPLPTGPAAPPAAPPATPLADDARAVRGWLAVAVGSLILAGAFSLLVVLARMPPFDRLVTDPGFFKRCLVVHVDLSLVVWFYAFLAALFRLIPGRARANPLARHGHLLATAGVALLVAGAAIPDAAPVLSNYVPMIDHALYGAGLVTIAAGLAMTFLDGRLLPGQEGHDGGFAMPSAARVGIRAAAVAFLIAVVTFWAAFGVTPRHLPTAVRAETIAWGGGHVLQFASVAGMLAVWLILVGRALGRSPVTRGVAAALFGLLVLPLFAAPLLAVRGARVEFTRLMQFGIFPVVGVFIFLCLRALWQARRPGLWREPGVIGVVASATLTLIGFAIGALIHGSNTTVPGHYHASIGAVTVAYMTIAYPLLAAVGAPVRAPRLARWSGWQPPLFGAGQLVFALGFTLAGAHGMARKSYGAEQHLRTPLETAGLIVMGVGGLVAIAGGLLFLWIVVSAWRARAHSTEAKTQWAPAATNIHSRS